ncbi:hypothetical protein SELMODRAFT_405668 [Selaginella moellendorffii]|uniref:Uncharacterized protein n=1 Tax=Selaginella moellendorffii TaxID=88036 RepID=D8QZB6_SELML|nr:hypothetical protein SELMODRAFT_405668 [Selaginella moellendorffii]
MALIVGEAQVEIQRRLLATPVIRFAIPVERGANVADFQARCWVTRANCLSRVSSCFIERDPLKFPNLDVRWFDHSSQDSILVSNMFGYVHGDLLLVAIGNQLGVLHSPHSIAALHKVAHGVPLERTVIIGEAKIEVQGCVSVSVVVGATNGIKCGVKQSKMGSVLCKGLGPASDLMVSRRPKICGFGWREEPELVAMTESTSIVTLMPEGSDYQPQIDWSSLLLGVFASLSGETFKNRSSWVRAIKICARAMSMLKAPKPSLGQQPGKRGELLVLSKDFSSSVRVHKGSILKLKSVTRDVLMQLVAKHPVVTSLRCVGPPRVLVKKEIAQTTLPIYNGKFDLECIPRCGVLLGYTPKFWIVYDPTYSISYKVRDVDPSGVGEFVLVAM